MEVNWKFFGYQVLAVFIIWLGMTIFYSDLKSSGVFIYYVVTSWLLFLIVLGVKQYFREKSENKDNKIE